MFNASLILTTEEAINYPSISDNSLIEAFLSLISILIAVLMVFVYVRDLIASGVCKKGFRHYYDDENENQETLNSSMSLERTSINKTKSITLFGPSYHSINCRNTKQSNLSLRDNESSDESMDDVQFQFKHQLSTKL